MVTENCLWSSKESSKDSFDFDIWDSLHQGKRIFSRPLVAESDDQRSFGSFYGRGVAILYLGQAIIREPFRLIKHCFVLVAEYAKTILDTLNLGTEKVRVGYWERVKEAWTATYGLILRPIAFVCDILRYLGAILVHPWLGMRVKN